MKPSWTLLLIPLLLAGFGCAPKATPAPTTPESPAPHTQEESTEQPPDGVFVQTTNGTNEDVPVTDVFLGEPDQIISLRVTASGFEPSVLNAKPGSSVRIKFTDVEGAPTFHMDATDSHYYIETGKTITFVAPTMAGTYTFYNGTQGKPPYIFTGSLIVKP